MLRRTARRARVLVLVATALVVITVTVAGCRTSSDPLGTAAAPPGSALPSSAACRAQVPADRHEERPQNTAANHVPRPEVTLPPWPDYWRPEVQKRIVARIDGDFTGTTDQIIRWGACKWGFDPDVVRAVAMTESSWDQAQLGDFSDNPADCVGGYVVPCPTSFGLLQIKHLYRPGSYPLSQSSTAFNVDYGLAAIRGCYEGLVTYLGNGYRAGDLWGCLGWHFSGDWNDPQAVAYQQRVRDNLDDKPWEAW